LRPDGLILLDKPAGITSFSSLNSLKSKLGTRRIGHTGTLDKFATGLLVVLIGKYTKTADLFSGLDKCYRAEIILGKTTDTLDPEGKVIGEGPLPDLSAVEQVVSGLTGSIEQIPPQYSAVHVDGQRAHRIVRAGGTAKLEPRQVQIYKIDIMGYDAPRLDVVVECSKGTYIRALARDLGDLAGSCAYVNRLRRTRVGPYEVGEAVAPEAFTGVEELVGSLQRLSRLEGICSLTVKEQMVKGVLSGRSLAGNFFTEAVEKDGYYTLLDPQGHLLALVSLEGGSFRYRMVV
jgi:tRNA pseudouridine55 synthase